MQNSRPHKSMNICPAMTSCRLTSWSILRFQVTRQRRLCRDNQGHIFMCYSCKAQMHVYSSSIKQCLPWVNHEQFPMQMTQNNKHNKRLEMLAGKNSSRAEKTTTTKSGEAERQSHRTATATSSTQRPQTCIEAATNTTITLQMKPMKSILH